MKPIKHHPQHAALQASANTLAVALGKVQARIVEIDAALCDPQQESGSKNDRRVEAALRFSETGRVEGGHPAGMLAERSLLQDQEAALRNALDTKHREIDTVEKELSAQLCAAKLPEHKKLAARQLALLEQFDELVAEEQAMFRSISAAGYEPRFSCHVEWRHLGRASDVSTSVLWYRLRELRAYVG